MSTVERLVYRGKSKDVFEIKSGPHAGKYRFIFTDRATGYIENGKPVFDTGYDVVVGDIPGKGAIVCRFTTRFFKLLKSKGISTHYIDTVGDNEIIVEPATPISLMAQAPEIGGSDALHNLEWTFRNQAFGSSWRRYPWLKPCQNIDFIIEAWTKGDSDILITFDMLEAAGVMTRAEIKDSCKLIQEVGIIIMREFSSKGLHIVDGKFELGRLKGGDGSIVLIDEVSPDCMRACQNYMPNAKGDCKVWKNCIQTKLENEKRTITAKKLLTADDLEKIFK